MKHSVLGAKHLYETDMLPTAELMVKRLLERRYWFEMQFTGGKYLITCGCDPQFINDKIRMNVEGSIKGNYKRKREVA